MAPKKLGLVVSMTGPREEQAAKTANTAKRAGIREFTVTKYRIGRIGSTDFGYDGPHSVFGTKP
jgi:hypothetical protein